MRIDAGVAITRQVQVALHHQIAVGGGTDNLDAGSQMERVGITGVIQPRQFALHQVVVGQRGVDELGALQMLAVQISLIDHLIRSATGRRVSAQWRIVVLPGRVQRNGSGALNIQIAAGINGDVTVDRIGNSEAHAPGIEFEGATGATVVLSRQAADSDVRAVPQIDACTVGQGQHTFTRGQVDHGAVRRIDDFAVAVHPQAAAVGIEQCAAAQGQGVFRRQANTTDALATGVHRTVDPQAAVIQRHRDVRRLKFVANDQVALLELETARAEHLALIQTLVQSGELFTQVAAATQTLRLDFDPTAQIRHVSATGVVIPAAAAENAALQVHHSGRRAQCHGTELARAVIARRQIDPRAGALKNVAVTALQNDFTAAAVLRQIIEGNGTPGHIDQRAIGQCQVVGSVEGQLAAGQHHRAGEVDAVAAYRQLGAQAVCISHSLGRAADIDGATGGDVVDRPGFTGHQRRDDVQVAAAVTETLLRIEGALGLVHREAAFVVGGDALAGRQIDIGKAQRQTIKAIDRVGLGKIAITELDALGLNVQASTAGAGTAGDHGAGYALGAVPDQVGGANRCHIIYTASAIHGRGGEHQVAQPRAPGLGIVGVEAGAAVEVQRFVGRQFKGFQRRRTVLVIALQQAFKHWLAEAQTGGQYVARRGIGQCLAAANVDVAHGQGQVARAVAYLIVQFQSLARGRDEAAFGVKSCLPGAQAVAAAHADRTTEGIGRELHIEQVIGYREQVGRLINEAVPGIKRRSASANAVDHRPLLDHQIAVAGHQENFRGREGRPLAQGNVRTGANAGKVDVVTALAIEHVRQSTDHQPRRLQGIQAVGIQRDAGEGRGSLLPPTNDFQIDVGDGRQCHYGTAIPTRCRVEFAGAVKGKRLFLGALEQGQFEGFGIHRQHRPWDTQPRGIGHRKLGVAGFVVLRITTQHITGGQDQLTGDAVAQPGIGHRERTGGGPRTIAHALRTSHATQSRQAVDLDPERARQQGIGGRHQRVGAGRQPGHASTNGDLTTDHRIDRATFSRHWCVKTLVARHDGVHRVAGKARQGKTTVGADLHQRVVTGIGRTATAGDKPGPQQITSTGQVQYGALLCRDRLPAQNHPDRQITVLIEHGSLADQCHILAPVAVGLTIDGTAIGQHQSLAADGSKAAGEQLDVRRVWLRHRTDFEKTQGCAHDATLFDRCSAQLQASEHRIRHRRRHVPHTTDDQ